MTIPDSEPDIDIKDLSLRTNLFLIQIQQLDMEKTNHSKPGL